MTRVLHFIWITSACLISSASAQSYCPEGKTASGACVNPALAASARLDSMIFAQPKISYTAFPLLPALDFLFRYPHNQNPDPGKPSLVGTPLPPPIP